MDPLVFTKLFTTLSELSVNLSAGLIGSAVIIVPIVSRRAKLDWKLLTVNILNGILALILSFIFKLL